LSELQAAWEADHARLEALEADRAHLDRLTAWAALPWWRRLFTPPPE
jgi:hypothetical protein